MLLIVQLMMILRHESMNIKEAIFAGCIIVKVVSCLGNYATNNPLTLANALGLGLFV